MAFQTQVEPASRTQPRRQQSQKAPAAAASATATRFVHAADVVRLPAYGMMSILQQLHVRPMAQEAEAGLRALTYALSAEEDLSK